MAAAVVTFVATGGNVALSYAAYNITSTIVGGAQAIAQGADPLRVIGSAAASICLNAVIPAFQSANLVLQVGVNAVRGAAIAAATTAIAGGNVGMGAAMGGVVGGVLGFAGSEQFNNWYNGKGFVSNSAVANAGASLNVAVSNKQAVEVYKRGLEGKDGNPAGLKLHPFMKDWQGDYHELEEISGKIKILEGDITNMSRATQAYMAGNPQPDKVTMVYGDEFFQAIKDYKTTYEGQAYQIWDFFNPHPTEFDCIGFKDYVLGRSRVK